GPRASLWPRPQWPARQRRRRDHERLVHLGVDRPVPAARQRRLLDHRAGVRARRARHDRRRRARAAAGDRRRRGRARDDLRGRSHLQRRAARAAVDHLAAAARGRDLAAHAGQRTDQLRSRVTMSNQSGASARRSLLVALAVLTCACVTAGPPVDPDDTPRPPAASSDADELAAFARLYGYLRFFHPSDAAAEADWDALAVTGAREVVKGSDQAALAVALQRFAEPIAPTVRVYAEGEPPPDISLAGEGPTVA